MRQTRRILGRWVFIGLICILIAGCTGTAPVQKTDAGQTEDDRIKIGFSMGTLQEERWQLDRDIFFSRATELGAEVIVLNANNNHEEQEKQVKFLIDQGIDILVIIPHDADKCAEAVLLAKKAGIKVISYDRLIRDANVDLYISFDNVKVGELMATELYSKVPKGNYVILKGAPTDNNSTMFYEGYMNILKKPIENQEIQVVAEIWVKDWAKEYAFACVEETLEKGVQIDGIIAANDSLASAAIEALSEKRLAGKVAVVGHDADLAACQRVVEGTQHMTVYKPIKKLARAAAEAAIKMAEGEEIEAEDYLFDGKYEVPYQMVEPITVTIDNMMDTIIDDSFHSMEDIYINVPKHLWPSMD